MTKIQMLIEDAAIYQQQSMVTSVAAIFGCSQEYLSSCVQLLASAGENALIVMTMHKAKGLEWPGKAGNVAKARL